MRFVYNYFLNKRIEKYKSSEGIYSYYDACKDLTALKKTEGYEWLKEADAHSLQNALKNMNYAYSEFFRRVRQKSGAPGFPKFKKKRENRQSYTSQAQTGRRVIAIEERKILLPKLGFVECRASRQIQGRILSASVFQVPSGKYYVSVCCTDYEPQPLPKTGEAVGIQFGIHTLATASDGKQYENNRYSEKSKKKLARLQRQLSRKSKDSKNREKARIKLAREYERISNQKTDLLQKLTTQLVRDYDVICIRDERLTDMMKNRLYAKYLSDAGWGEIVSQLTYKCGWYSKELVKISNWHPSAQLCSSCGYQNPEVSKKNRPGEWDCPDCGTHHNREINAAANILAEGLRQLATSEESPVFMDDKELDTALAV